MVDCRIRIVEGAGVWQILFYRSISLTLLCTRNSSRGSTKLVSKELFTTQIIGGLSLVTVMLAVFLLFKNIRCKRNAFICTIHCSYSSKFLVKSTDNNMVAAIVAMGGSCIHVC